jgi:hypothetical protein
MRAICRILGIIILLIGGSTPPSLAFTNYQQCDVSSDVDFFDLTAYPVEAYMPSVDEDGNTYLRGVELENAAANHYRNQYSKANVVRLTMDRYASLTANSPDVFKNFESKLIIVDPECNELKLFYGNLIGNSVVGLRTYFKMYDAAERLEHKALQEFIKQRVSLKSKFIHEIIRLLKSDLAYDPALTKATLAVQFLKDMRVGEGNNHKIGGELALLAFAKKGGEIKSKNIDLQAFIISPQSFRGIKQYDKALVLLSTGVAHVIPDLDVRLTKYALGQLGVSTTEVFIKKIHDGDDVVCQLDEVKHWYTVENGSVTRECNFTQLIIKSIQTDGWKATLDEESNPISYSRISDIYARHGIIKIVY